MANTEPTIIIIGAGTFGVSTAYHLAQTYADPSRVTIIDREPSPPASAAAIDINRIIRADYPSTLYCNLANEALHTWFWSPELGPCFHKVGWLMLDGQGSDLKNRIYETLKGRGTHIMQDVTLASIASGERWSILEGTKTAGFGEAYFNPDAGWVDAANATRRFMETAVKKGVRRVVGDVVELLLNREAERVEGVRTADGQRLTADKVVLATGAWTSYLVSPVEDSFGIKDQDRVERQAQATAIVSAYYRIGGQEVEKMIKCEMPCVIYGKTGEVIPPSRDNGLLKYNNSATKLINTITTVTGKKISVPPMGMDQRRIPRRLKQETEAILTSRLMPQFSRSEPEYWRLCWDSCTPTEDLLLCQHPSIKSMFVITGGSFCGYKFMPNIGKYMLNVLDGQSNGSEKDKAWGWKTEAKIHAARQPVPTEIRDFDVVAGTGAGSRL